MLGEDDPWLKSTGGGSKMTEALVSKLGWSEGRRQGPDLDSKYFHEYHLAKGLCQLPRARINKRYPSEIWQSLGGCVKGILTHNCGRPQCQALIQPFWALQREINVKLCVWPPEVHFGTPIPLFFDWECGGPDPHPTSMVSDAERPTWAPMVARRITSKRVLRSSAGTSSKHPRFLYGLCVACATPCKIIILGTTLSPDEIFRL